MINFNCASCRKALHIRDAMAGNLAACPYCGAESLVPNNPMRTSKLTIIGRMVAIPMICVGAVGALLGTPVIIGGAIGLAVMFGFWWGVTNLAAFLFSPTYYRLWRKGGGDPWFDTLPSPLNNDPDSTRYQEMYREKSRQEWEASFGPLPIPSPPPDSTKSLDDPNVI
jgi:DNA-directed RNA polymerase subunit RPC12/RpoP